MAGWEAEARRHRAALEEIVKVATTPDVAVTVTDLFGQPTAAFSERGRDRAWAKVDPTRP